MDVLHLVPGFFPDQGGIQTLLASLSAHLHERHGYSSAVLTPSATPGLEGPRETDSLPVYRLGSQLVGEPGGIESTRGAVPEFEGISALSQLFAETRRVFSACLPRLVHIHQSPIASVPAAAIARSQNVPVISHVHGLLDGQEPTSFRQRLEGGGHVIAVSEAVRRSILDRYPSAHELMVIRNAIPDPLSGTKPWRPVSPSVGLVSRLTTEKGIAYGIRALALVRERIPDLRIRLVGSGPEEAALWELCQALNLESSVDYVGSVDNQRALGVIAGVDVVVVPSVETEGFSLTALEAALLGKPVVGTMVGGLPETVHEGTTGVLVPPRDVRSMADAVSRLLLDTTMYETMSRAARERALVTYSMDRFADEVAVLYDTILLAESPRDRFTK